MVGAGKHTVIQRLAAMALHTLVPVVGSGVLAAAAAERSRCMAVVAERSKCKAAVAEKSRCKVVVAEKSRCKAVGGKLVVDAVHMVVARGVVVGAQHMEVAVVGSYTSKVAGEREMEVGEGEEVEVVGEGEVVVVVVEVAVEEVEGEVAAVAVAVENRLAEGATEEVVMEEVVAESRPAAEETAVLPQVAGETAELPQEAEVDA